MPDHSDSAFDVVEMAAALIRFDTTNAGGADAKGERAAAEYIADRLAGVGGRPQLLERVPGRTSVLLRIPGAAPSADGIVIHGHLDVVPADPAEWTVDPFGGTIRDGFLWGRGAIDMKGADAMMLATACRLLRDGAVPQRDIVFAWLADEEAGGAMGAGWLCSEHPGLFEGCRTAIGEVGGFGIPLGAGRTLYPIGTAERGHARLELTAGGTGGHACLGAAPDNAIAQLCGAVAALANYEFPAVAVPAVREFLLAAGPLLGRELRELPIDQAVAALGPLGALVTPVLRHSAVPTMVRAGQAPNVVPGSATAILDCRILPGLEDDFRDRVAAVVPPSVQHRLVVHTAGTSVPFDGPVTAAMVNALRRADGGAVPVPYMVPAATDAPHFARLGMATFGFTPLLLPPGFRYGALFHGPDEHVPVQGLRFGARVLEDFVLTV